MNTIGRISRPLLIFAADPELGGIVTPEVVAKIRALNPAVTVAVVPGVGHLIRFDNPSAFLRELRAFLKRIAG
jgi:pimeloyl-ACP methyl ester carboxylesterase